MNLTGKQKRFLRSLGHNLQPVVHVGKGGISDALAAAANQALDDHELIKVRLLDEVPVDRSEAADELAVRCEAVVAQVLGRTVLLYRRRLDDPKIVLPGKREETAEASS